LGRPGTDLKMIELGGNIDSGFKDDVLGSRTTSFATKRGSETPDKGEGGAGGGIKVREGEKDNFRMRKPGSDNNRIKKKRKVRSEAN